jgi:phosphatidate cytidylyltransferase
MLKNRIITALVLAPLIILGILYLPEVWLAAAFAAIITAAAWEWSDLSGLTTLKSRLVFLASAVLLMATYRLWAGYLLEWLAWPVVAWWFVLSILIRRIPSKLVSFQYPVLFRLFIGLFVLVSAWILLVWTSVNLGRVQLLYLVILIWLADISAYFAGKKWGLTRLCPDLSPGKTVAGLYGALLVAVVFAIAVGMLKEFSTVLLVDFVVLSALTVLVSVVGDLFESLAKRIRGVKDSGAALPGHGGVLDRIDSVIAGVSVFYAGCSELGIYFQ